MPADTNQYNESSWKVLLQSFFGLCVAVTSSALKTRKLHRQFPLKNIYIGEHSAATWFFHTKHRLETAQRMFFNTDNFQRLLYDYVGAILK